MQFVDDEYRLLARTERLGPALVDRLRELRGRPALPAAAVRRSSASRRSVRARVRSPRAVRPPG